jgi:hypothetical protein
VRSMNIFVNPLGFLLRTPQFPNTEFSATRLGSLNTARLTFVYLVEEIFIEDLKSRVRDLYLAVKRVLARLP